MKRFFSIFAAIALLGSLLANALPAFAAGPNSILNPQVAQPSTTVAGTPANWKTDKWGTNTTTLTYKTTEGHGDTSSLYVQTTARTSGDAKWYFDNVAVKPNTSYTFTDWSKSNVQSKATVMYTSTTGAISYFDMLTVPVSATAWQQNSVTFTTPANVKSLSMLHLLAKVGWLQTDDFSLVDNSVSSVIAPTVTIASPTGGSTVSNTTTITANANGGSGSVAGVQFKIDGANFGAEDVTAPYTIDWDTKTVADGAHTISATIRNSQAATANSTNVAVTVSNPVAPAPNTPPTVAITTPANNATVSAKTTISVNASDTDGVAGVTFKLDGNVMGTEDTVAPYGLDWDTTAVANGQHTLTATARDAKGATTIATATVTVNNTVVVVPSDNLVLNPSLETADPANAGKPDQWLSNSWGTNTTSFTYPVTGAASSRAARTTISTYTNGDAKWYFSPVAVSASTQYTFRDMYRASVGTEAVAMYTSTTGAVTYGFLGSLPASTTWTAAEFPFTTPAGTASMSVFHVIAAVGFLEVDDASITKVAAPTPSANPIANPSLETASGALPANWVSSKWGTNTSNFQYITNDGHNSTKSAKVTVSNYTDGDAKWLFNPITTLEKGKMYRWSTWYKTNTHPQAVAMFTTASGTEKFFGMPQPFPKADSATNWTEYSDTFIVPDDAASVSVFLFIAGNGWVQVDDQNITPYTSVGFNRPLVTLTFDDGHEENVTNALPVLNQYGFKSTQCYETADLKASADGGKGPINAFMSSGHEICSHTVNHPFLTKATSAQLTTELKDSQAYLQSLTGTPVVDFASPYGDYNEAVNTEIKKYYQSHRTVDEGYNSKDNFDAYRLRVQNMTPTTTLAEYNGWLAHAKATNTWLILVYHDVVTAPATPTPYGSYTPDFKQQMAALNASGIQVLTYKDALAETKAQL